MRKIILSAGIILSSVFANVANAMPLAQPSIPSASSVQKVDYTCGRGFHLSPRGYCRPNGPPREYRDRWDRRDRWAERREWRDRRDHREWRERRDWHQQREWRGRHGYRDYRW
ncbi:GCG_CRPN prefix-to-repeats domain-containing protein [Agrobacterium sp. rho-13.3]|uniref:GCG_CRPN prefix-to-repeats domain-containing protein n=1 Tax=Agrobacterium sp. rho-13.3 TaxID=3072980 RepID=UPI0039B7356B